jgi:hypothetical protein
MDIRECVRFYDDDDLSELKIRYPMTVECLIELASYKIDSFKIHKMDDLLEYVDGNGFSITYNAFMDKYIVRREKTK